MAETKGGWSGPPKRRVGRPRLPAGRKRLPLSLSLSPEETAAIAERCPAGVPLARFIREVVLIATERHPPSGLGRR